MSKKGPLVEWINSMRESFSIVPVWWLSLENYELKLAPREIVESELVSTPKVSSLFD